VTVIDSMPSVLPYGPALSRWLRPLQRSLLAVNDILVAPALHTGFGRLIGNPLTGRLMLLRTRGRRTGRVREAPLGYVIRGGAIWCVAGYGRRTPWYLNLLADPDVEVRLPSRTIKGIARPVDDPAEWLAAYRALIASFGFIGRVAVGSVGAMPDAELLRRHRSLPVVRIDPTDPPGPIQPGRWDRGAVGAFVLAAWFALIVGVVFLAARARAGASPR